MNISALSKKFPQMPLQNIPKIIQPGSRIAKVFADMPKLSRLDENRKVEFFDLKTELRNAVVFTMPGAFTPVCSKDHLPSVAKVAHQFKEKLGLDVYCAVLSNRDVAKAWQDSCEASKVKMIPDYLGNVATLTGMITQNANDNERQLGLRFPRAAFLVLDGVIRDVQIDENPAQCLLSHGQKVFERTALYFENVKNHNGMIPVFEAQLDNCQKMEQEIMGKGLDENEFYSFINPDEINHIQNNITKFSEREERTKSAESTYKFQIKLHRHAISSPEMERRYKTATSLAEKAAIVREAAGIPLPHTLGV